MPPAIFDVVRMFNGWFYAQIWPRPPLAAETDFPVLLFPFRIAFHPLFNEVGIHFTPNKLR